jgi:glycerate kinase
MGETVTAGYVALPDGLAVVEAASACGLTLASAPNPERTTSYGVGELIRHALNDGCRSILLCIGGSATNDAGAGLAAALGAKFFNADGEAFIPVGGTLAQIEKINFDGLDARLTQKKIHIACDVVNPLYGSDGAAYVYAAQKGADAQMIARLDEGLRSFSHALSQNPCLCDPFFYERPGCGAAGGMAACFIALGLATLSPGIERVLDAAQFDRHAQNTDWVITGEGQTDAQTLQGKVVAGVLRRAKIWRVPTLVISGAAHPDTDEALYAEGARAVFSTLRMAGTFENIQPECEKWLYHAALNIFRLIPNPPLRG